MLRSRIGIAVIVSALVSVPAFAQYDLSWYTIDGGGAMFTTGGSFELSGTIGQPDAGVMVGGSFELQGGFWAGASAPAPCLGDLTGDGGVGLDDLAILLANYGTPSGADPSDGDIDMDGDVDLTDLSILLSVYGTVC